MKLKEAMALCESGDKKRICRKGNRGPDHMKIYFTSKNGLLYIVDISPPTKVKLSDFQTSEHEDWMVY